MPNYKNTLIKTTTVPIVELTDELQNTPIALMTSAVGYDDSEPDVVFIYIASIYDDENNKIDENGVRYKDVFVFDNKPNLMKQYPEDECGIYRDAILGQFGKTSGRVY